jgi:hypothetical protein
MLASVDCDISVTRPTKLIGTLPLRTMTLPGVMPAWGTAGTQAFLASGQTTGVQEVQPRE